MWLDANKIRSGTVLDADVCIVGAGPAGLTLARELDGPTGTVICLESGGIEGEESAQALNEGRFIGAVYSGLRNTRNRQIGGTAGTWNTPLFDQVGAKYVPLDACDFAPHSGVDHEGWPISRAHVEPYYRRAQAVCGLGPFAYEGELWCSQKKAFPLPDTRLRHAVYQFGPANVFVRLLPGAIELSENVQLLYHATACNLTFDRQGRSASAVNVANAAGARFKVRSRLFVLAGGAVENARLLLVSREPGCEAPGNAGNWLGRCFMEHPRDYAISWHPRGPEIYGKAAFFDRHVAENGAVIAGRLALAESIIVQESLLNASASLLPLPVAHARGIAGLRRLLGKLSGGGVRATGGYGWSTPAGSESLSTGFRLLLNVEQRSHRENRLVLSSDRDRFGIPKALVHWRWRPDEQAELERVRTVFADALRAANVGRVEVDANRRPDPNAHHHAGTTRMGKTISSSVVDADGRVHKTDNLYVTGSSVFPTAGFANPTLTIVALSLRLADHLKSRR